jgi:anti-sigma regulatory factor (Ser/Thr protein kinase)
MTRSVDIRIRNELSELATPRDELDRLAAEWHIPEDALVKLQVALDEIASNVVNYAWQDGANHEICIRIAAQSDGVTIEIIDDGAPFDPSLYPDPLGRPSRPGGLGVMMVKKLVDEIAYHHRDGRNHTILTKKCAVGDSGGSSQR